MITIAIAVTTVITFDISIKNTRFSHSPFHMQPYHPFRHFSSNRGSVWDATRRGEIQQARLKHFFAQNFRFEGKKKKTIEHEFSTSRTIIIRESAVPGVHSKLELSCLLVVSSLRLRNAVIVASGYFFPASKNLLYHFSPFHSLYSGVQ